MKNFLTSSITGNFRTDFGMAFEFEDNEVINVTSNFVSNMQIRWFTSRFPFTCSLVSSLHIEQIQTLRRISLSQSEKLFYPWLCIEKFQLDHTWINFSMIWYCKMIHWTYEQVNLMWEVLDMYLMYKANERYWTY